MHRTPLTIVVVGLAKAADSLTTYWALQRPGTAENLPITRWAIAAFGLELGLVLVTIGAVVGAVALVELVARSTTVLSGVNGVPEWYPTVMQYGSVAVLGVAFVGLAINNLQYLA